MVTDPTFHAATTLHSGVLFWKWADQMTALSSAPVGGGLGEPSWVANIGVSKDYGRVDLVDHAQQVTAELGVTGTGVVLFTAADVRQSQRGRCEGVAADGTVGISKPTWAADSTAGYTPWTPGTINVVIQLPVGLEPSAAVNAVMTVTEAKTQALLEGGVPGTGTASDAVVIVWPTNAATERFGGPRSMWGSRIAQAAYSAVQSGITTWSR